jgi:hypothetical protein
MQIVIPFAQIDAVNPNLPGKDLKSTVMNYLRCIAVSCQSFRQMNPKIRIVVITNQPIENEIVKILLSLNVEIEITPFRFNPPSSFGDKFRGCFFFFDALQTLNADSLIIDPDVICLENLDEIARNIKKNIAVFRPSFSANKIINGISPNHANKIYGEFIGRKIGTEPRHIGGEAIFFPKDSIKQFMLELITFWEWNIERAKKGQDFLTTEEHILTCLLSKTSCDSLSPYISRIWTTKRYREIEGEVRDLQKLILWHLPSEKAQGFQTIFKSAFVNNSSISALSFDREFYLKSMNLKPKWFEKNIYFFYRKLISLKAN